MSARGRRIKLRRERQSEAGIEKIEKLDDKKISCDCSTSKKSKKGEGATRTETCADERDKNKSDSAINAEYTRWNISGGKGK